MAFRSKLVTSGETPKSSSSDTAVPLIAALQDGVFMEHVVIDNEGAVAGFFSIDGGTTWARLPASTVVVLDGVWIASTAIQVKRVSGGSDITDVYGWAW